MADAATKRREERVKLVASAVSNVGVAAIVSGVIAPLVTGRFEVVLALGGLLFGFGVQVAAQCILHYVIADDAIDSEVER